MRSVTGRLTGLVVVCLLAVVPTRAYADPIAGGSGGGGAATALTDLTDIILTSPQEGALLIRTGSAWVDGAVNLANTNAVTGLLADANIAAAIARDAEVAAAYQPLDSDLTDLAVDGILTFSKVGAAIANRCARFNASGVLSADTADCTTTGPTGTTATTFTIDSDAVGTEPANGAGIVIEGGSGDVSWLWDAANNVFRLTGPAGTVVEFPDPADGSRGFDVLDNIAERLAPTAGRTILYPLGGEWYKKDTDDSTSERLMLNSGNVSGAMTCNASGVCAIGNDTFSLTQASDVTLSSPATGSVLIKSASDWVNGAVDLADTDAVTGTLPVARGGLGISFGVAGGIPAFSSGGVILSTPLLVDGGLLLGGGASGVPNSLGVATNGQIPIGDGTTDPVLATITGTANQVAVTNGAGSITISIPTDPTLPGTVTATAFATAGCSLNASNVDCDADATAGGTLHAKEGADDGTATLVFKVPDTGLTGDAAITHTTDAGGKFDATDLLTAGTFARGVIHRNVTAVVHTGTVSQTNVWSTTITGGTLAAGDLHLRISGKYQNVTSAGSITVKLIYGSTTMWGEQIGGTIAAPGGNVLIDVVLRNTTSASVQLLDGIAWIGFPGLDDQGDGSGNFTAGGNNSAILRGPAAVDSTANQTLALAITLPNTNADCIFTFETAEIRQ